MRVARSRYASGKHALGMCMRSGLRAPYSKLVQDGYDRNLWVLPDFYDPPHPIERIPPAFDAQNLHHPSPELARPGITVRAGRTGTVVFNLTMGQVTASLSGASVPTETYADDSGQAYTDESGTPYSAS